MDEELTLAEQMRRQRERWREEARQRFHERYIVPPARQAFREEYLAVPPIVRWEDEAVRTYTSADGTIHYAAAQTFSEMMAMPTQEDDIVLLDDAPARAAQRVGPIAARAVAESIVAAEPDGIAEVTVTQTAKRKKGKATVKILPEKPAPILHQGSVVSAKGNCLYIHEGSDRIRELAYSQYMYTSYSGPHTEAVAVMHGRTPVFCLNKQELAKFKAMLEKVDIIVAEGKSLFFFSGTEFWLGDDNAVCLVFDGETIRYGASGNDERIMRLTSPIAQKPEQIFSAITSFANRSVHGVSQQLAIEKDRLKQVTDRRSEEVFLYLSDITPPADKEDVHGFALSRLQEVYNADLSQIGQLKATVKSYVDKINKAKSQVPNGRKGVPLRNGYLKSPVLTDLLDYFKVIRDVSSLKTIFVFKKDLILEGIHYGRPEITVNMTCSDGVQRRAGTFIREQNGVQVRSADKQAFMHPHIEGYTRWCLGTYIVPINNAIMGGNVPLAASLLWKYLSNYNVESPLIRLDTCRDQMAAARQRDLIVRRK